MTEPLGAAPSSHFPVGVLSRLRDLLGRRSHPVVLAAATPAAAAEADHDDVVADDELAGDPQLDGWVPFDDERRKAGLQQADIVFGPDPFDPRIQAEYPPMLRAIEEGKSDIDRADLSKTIGEVFGPDASLAEIREQMRANARSIRLDD